MTLQSLSILAGAARDTFVLHCVADGYASEWAAYRDDKNWSPELLTKWEAMRTAEYAYYAARDGERGFLGSRGL